MCSSSFQTSPNNPRRAIRTVQVARPAAWARPLADGSHLGRGLHRTCRRSPPLSGAVPGPAGRRGGRWRHSEAHGPSPHRCLGRSRRAHPRAVLVACPRCDFNRSCRVFLTRVYVFAVTSILRLRSGRRALSRGGAGVLGRPGSRVCHWASKAVGLRGF